MSISPSRFGRERWLLGYPTAGLFLLHHLLHAAPWRSSLVFQTVLYGFQISAHLADDSKCYTRNDDNNDYEDVTDKISQQNARRWSYSNPWKDSHWNQVSFHARPIKISSPLIFVFMASALFVLISFYPSLHTYIVSTCVKLWTYLVPVFRCTFIWISIKILFAKKNHKHILLSKELMKLKD